MAEKWILIRYPCPNCGEYGGAYAVRNKKDGNLLLYCDECDCLWKTPAGVDCNDVLKDCEELFEWGGYASRAEVEAFSWGEDIIEF